LLISCFAWTAVLQGFSLEFHSARAIKKFMKSIHCQMIKHFNLKQTHVKCSIGIIGIKIHFTPASHLYLTQNYVCFYIHYVVFSTFECQYLGLPVVFCTLCVSLCFMYSIYYQFYNGCVSVCLMYSIYYLVHYFPLNKNLAVKSYIDPQGFL
jgi:hypothetical protein